MEDKIIDFETAELAKEKGFDERVPQYYGIEYNPPKLFDTGVKQRFKGNDNVVKAPTQSLLQKWLREEHDILVLVDEGFFNLIWKIIIPDHELPQKIYSEDNFNTYEKALEEGLQKALKLI